MTDFHYRLRTTQKRPYSTVIIIHHSKNERWVVIINGGLIMKFNGFLATEVFDYDK